MLWSRKTATGMSVQIFRLLWGQFQWGKQQRLGSGYSGFQVSRLIKINGGKNQNSKNPFSFQQNPPKKQTINPKKIPCWNSEPYTLNKNIRNWMFMFVYSSYHVKLSFLQLVALLTTLEKLKNICRLFCHPKNACQIFLPKNIQNWKWQT